MPGSNLTRIEAEERKAVIEAPIHYHVDLDLTVGAKNFGSKSLICFNAKPGSSTFLDLIADEVTSIDLNGKSLDPAVAFQDNRIELTDLKEKNEVTVEARCRYSNTGEGLHRSVDPSDGNIYLYSQFEVPDARRVYAVFDQPDLKATFDFKVLAPASWIVTSNMPVATIEDDPRETLDGTLGDKPNESTRLWDFEPTPVMSSYLTAICAGPYAEWHTEYLNEDGRTVPMAQYCRQSLAKAFAKDVDYLFDITKKGFAFYAKTWGVPYPYAKFDQIYVPEYNAGAMENIGMVTIRDQYVFESKVTDAYAERRVVTVLHELAHMWFGDYVTMKWWNDLWLNESFAEFTSTLATAEATEWHDAWATFCSGEKSWALRQDQLPTTHPIVAPINDLNDTYVNFDGITYAKGASVLKQLAFYVGPHAVLRRYPQLPEPSRLLQRHPGRPAERTGKDLRPRSQGVERQVAGGIRHQHDRHWPDRKRGRHHRRTEAHPERAGRTPGAAPASPGRRLLQRRRRNRQDRAHRAVRTRRGWRNHHRRGRGRQAAPGIRAGQRR